MFPRFSRFLFPTVERPPIDQQSASFKKEYAKNLQLFKWENDDPREMQEEEKKADLEDAIARKALQATINYFQNATPFVVGGSRRPEMRKEIKGMMAKGTAKEKALVQALMEEKEPETMEEKEALKQALMGAKRALFRAHQETAEKALNRVMMYWQQPNGINETYTAVRNYLDNYLADTKNTSKNFSTPIRVCSLCFFL